MNSFVERLETRSLLSASAYPVVANDAAVLADNQHLTNDKAQLTADTASFRTLIANDKTALQTTLAQDRSAVKTALVSVKAETNDPTLLTPAQTALENAMIKLSGDTASLKTKLSVDSANQKATLGIDTVAMRTDQSLLKIDTQAAGVAFNNSAKRISSDIVAIEARGPASTAIVATMEGDVNAASRGVAKPGVSSVTSFASVFATTLNGSGLPAKQQTALAQDVIDVVNSGGVPAGQTQGVIANAQALLMAGGASAVNTQATVAGLGALIIAF